MNSIYFVSYKLPRPVLQGFCELRSFKPKIAFRFTTSMVNNSTSCLDQFVPQTIFALTQSNQMQLFICNDVQSVNQIYKQMKIKHSSFKSNETFIRNKMGHTTQFRLIKPNQWTCNDPATKARRNIL